MEHKEANMFMLNAICEFGQSEEVRIAAVQGILDVAGLKATAEGWPVFGGIWNKPCSGKDGEAATAWLQELTDSLKRGEYNDEVRQLNAAINARLAA